MVHSRHRHLLFSFELCGEYHDSLGVASLDDLACYFLLNYALPDVAGDPLQDRLAIFF